MPTNNIPTGITQKSNPMEDTLKKSLLLFGLLMTLAIPSGMWAQQAGQ
jgi:hypothetical protein